MSYKNPTRLQIGAQGKLFGRIYHVVGRAVLGVSELNRIYFWNEYYLKSDDGEIATLVYEEESLSRGEWKWFTMFDPQIPMAADEAATKRIEDLVVVDDINARVTLVRRSKVYHVEGHAPEGVIPGAQAHYFNATDGGTLLVVSWTGEEVEFYRGMYVSRGALASGFHLSKGDLGSFKLTSTTNGLPILRPAVVIFFIFVLLMLLAGFIPLERSRPPAVVAYDLTRPSLSPGDSGRLNGTKYLIEGHAVVEIDGMNQKMFRHEYFLRDEDGGEALLIFGWKAGENNWLLFTPQTSIFSLTPKQAGNVHLGETIAAGDINVTVNELFQSTVQHTEGTNSQDTLIGEMRYGFIGQSGVIDLLVRWNESGIVFEKGRLLQGVDVTREFNSSGKN